MGFPAFGPWVMKSVAGEPYPTGAEEADTGVDKSFLEFLEGTEVAVDCLTETSRGLAGAFRREGEEIEDVVPGLGGVVKERTLGVGDNLFKLHVLEFSAFDEAVEVVDIGLFVLAVVEVDGARADGGLQRVGLVGELGLFVFHKE